MKDYVTKIDAWFNEEIARLLQDGDVAAFKTALEERIIDAYRDGYHRCEEDSSYVRLRDAWDF